MEQNRLALEELKQDRIFSHFYQISQIPRGSGNEAALSRYIADWATGQGYEVVTDAAHNVLIRAAASKGFEDRPPVMLQAHMDMVCEKLPDSSHDFEKDPIPLAVKGDLLTTGGETTLGADDGIGVALAMALLADGDWQHPELEVLFTTNEEEDFSGAATFDMAQMKSRYLLNLDHVREGEIMCGSCGGMRVDIHIPLDMQPLEPGKSLYQITVSGLVGGHSGEDIHRGRGSANALLGRVLLNLGRCCSYRLISLRGGTFRLAIPREAACTIAADAQDEPKIKEMLSELTKAFRTEMALSGRQVKVELERLAAESNLNENGYDNAALLKAADPQKVVTAMALMPDGIYQLNEAFAGTVDTSDNLGEIYLEGDELHMISEIRSAAKSLREALFDKMALLAEMLGGTAEWADAYPSWDFHAGSYLQKLSDKVYHDMTGQSMHFMTVHAGLEVGYFLERYPEIDALSIGPDIWDFHSPSERVSISSTQRVYEFLKVLIGEIGA